MTGRSLAASLLLGVAAALAGCAAPPSKPQTPAQQAARPVAPAPAESTEPAVPPPSASPEPNDLEPALPEEGASAETTEPVTTEQPETTPTDKTADAEPNLPEASVPAAPAETAPVEPNESEDVRPPAEAAPTDDVGADGMTSFYQEYAEILHQYVRADGRVDYDGLRRKRLAMRDLLIQVGQLDPNVYRQWTDDEKLAFWINVYNLKMLDIITRNYPIQSSWWLRLTWPPSDIRHIGGIWSDYRFIVMDEEFTLRAVEQRFFRKTFGDPRAFLAITYASRSSPPLRRTPYRGRDLNGQLDEQVRTFLASSRGFRIDRNKAVVYLSALFKPTWRGKDFVARYGTDKKFKDRPPETRAVLNFITQYLSPDDVYFLEVENYSLEYMNFDWRLNDAG